MKKIFILLELLFIAFVCGAQVNDDFTDGDLTNSPMWRTDQPANWTVINGQLRSNSSAANSTFYITTPSAKASNAQWEFFVNLQFNTSSANFVDIYLMSEQSNLLSATNNGYFVRIGGTTDEISLYKLTAGTATLLINGADGVTNSSNNTLRIKIILDGNNLWSLERDAAGGTNYFLEGTVTDNAFTTSNFFGIRVQQSTASFFNRHFFDDLYAGEIIVDSDPPLLQQLQVLSENQLSLTFNEKLTSATAQNTSHYSASQGIGNPATAVLQADETTIILAFSQNFSNGITHQLTIIGVADLLGNSVTSINSPFLFFQPQPVNAKDIIITEIFADPTPQVGLPDAEFIELYNRSSNPVDLAGWKFSDGSSTATFPSHLILPGDFRIITASSNTASFTSFGTTVGVSNFPTLNNGGEPLTLKTSTGLLIDSVNYALSWYRDTDKQEGGWALELIDLNNSCGEEDNWEAAEDAKGGTPGKINSVNANKPDLTGPKLVSVAAIKTNELLLVFNEKLEKPLSTNLFSIAPSIDISTAVFASQSLKEVKLTLIETVAPRQLYTITITNLRDCSGNYIQEAFNSLSFALPELAEAGDLLLNEILFNPRPGGVDFVEIINVSEKYLNLKNWSLANLLEGVAINNRTISAQDLVIAPGEYTVFTIEGVTIKSQYPNAQEENFVTSTLPSLNDDNGSIALISNEGILMDHFLYTDDYHTPLLKDKEGVSLERISLTELTNLASNWKSASSVAGFATPGYLNSNSRPETFVDDNAVTIEPEIFSPVIPGQDFTKINYRFDQGGFVANVKIVDLQGRLIKEIANNETLSIEGFLRWDGDRDDGSKARRGYYFVWMEVFSLEGTIKNFRKRVAIGQ